MPQIPLPGSGDLKNLLRQSERVGSTICAPGLLWIFIHPDEQAFVHLAEEALTRTVLVLGDGGDQSFERGAFPSERLGGAIGKVGVARRQQVPWSAEGRYSWTTHSWAKIYLTHPREVRHDGSGI